MPSESIPPQSLREHRTFRWSGALLALVSLVALGASVPEQPPKNPFASDEWVLPVEIPELRAGSGQELVKNNCLLCHSTDYILNQPPLNRTQWSAGVEKMRGKFGAVIPTNKVPGIVEYLVTTYGTEAKRTAPAKP